MPSFAVDHYQPESDLLAARIVLVTGAGAGIGKACALAAARCGATVILLGRTVSKLEAVYDQIEQAGGTQPAIYPLDLEAATPDHYAELSATIGDSFGHLDGLVHCAALFDGLVPLANTSPVEWYRSLQVNLNAPFLLSQALLVPLRQSTDAAIVFSHDQVADRGRAYWGPYAVAKAGQQALMKLLAEELETNTPVRVCSVDPGPVNTRLRLQAYPTANPLWRSPECVANAYLYCLGPQGRALNGELLTLDPVS